MPLVELPSGGSALFGGDLPVTDGDDVLAEFADTHRKPDSAPVRDAFCEAFAQSHVDYQDAASEALAQCDPLRATGDNLVSLALEREVIPYKGESEESLRSRLFASPDIVTPDAIVRAVNRVLLTCTTKECQLVELELDGLFVHDGTSTAWDSFIGEQPRYPDRYYSEDAAENDGFFLENNAPGGALVSWGGPRTFHLRLPDLGETDETLTFAIDAADEIMPVADGSDTSGAESDGSVATSVYVDGLTAEEIYTAIVAIVDSAKGQGMSWSAYADPEI